MAASPTFEVYRDTRLNCSDIKLIHYHNPNNSTKISYSISIE